MFVTAGALQAPSDRTWPTIATTVTRAWQALPPKDRTHTATVAEIYPTAAALEVFGRPTCGRSRNRSEAVPSSRRGGGPERRLSDIPARFVLNIMYRV
jgi:hypothetical protein